MKWLGGVKRRLRSVVLAAVHFALMRMLGAVAASCLISNAGSIYAHLSSRLRFGKH